MSRSTGHATLLERARERAWKPMAERVELQCALSILRDDVETWDTFLERAAEAIGEHYDGGCALSVLSDDERVMNVIGAYHADADAHDELELFLREPVPVLERVEGPALDNGQGRVFELHDADFEHRPAALRYILASRATHGAVVPLRARGGLTGVVWLSVDRALTTDDLRFLEEIASRVGAIVDHLRLSSGDVQAELPVEHDGVAQLTEREREVLVLVARGMTSKQIADELVLSARTIEWHRGRIQAKLGVSGRAEMTRIALECNLVAAAT